MAYYKLMPLRIPRLHSMGIAPAMRRARVTGGDKGSTRLSPFRTPHIGRRTGSSASRLTLHRPAEEKRVRPFDPVRPHPILNIDASELRPCCSFRAPRV